MPGPGLRFKEAPGLRRLVRLKERVKVDFEITVVSPAVKTAFNDFWTLQFAVEKKNETTKQLFDRMIVLKDRLVELYTSSTDEEGSLIISRLVYLGCVMSVQLGKGKADYVSGLPQKKVKNSAE